VFVLRETPQPAGSHSLEFAHKFAGGNVTVTVSGGAAPIAGDLRMAMKIDGAMQPIETAKVTVGMTPEQFIDALEISWNQLNVTLNRTGTNSFSLEPTIGAIIDDYEFDPVGLADLKYKPFKWVSIAKNILSKPTRASVDSADPLTNDIQITTEKGHKEIKIWDRLAGVWVVVYSEDNVQNWIAAGNLFVGTVEETGHGIAGAIDLGNMPSTASLGATDKGHYWTWVGSGGYVVPANAIGGGASAIDGQLMNVGDWIQVAEVSTGVYAYTAIPGDLLAKARGDSLYGMHTWTAGAYEYGAVIVHQGKLYKANTPVLSTDPAPSAATNTKWTAVNLSAGVHNVPADANLPATAPAGDVYLVINSASNGNLPTFYLYDAPTLSWVNIGGKAPLPLSLAGGEMIYNIGVPIGTISMWPSTVLPNGYLLCDGASFNATKFPALAQLLTAHKVPDLRGQFVRGLATGEVLDTSFPKIQYQTARPTKTDFSGHTSAEGQHHHRIETLEPYDLKASWTHRPNTAMTGMGDGPRTILGYSNTDDKGLHEHTFHVTTGGDHETAPNHVIMQYIIKAEEQNMSTRII
jgi:hypothetical protein